MTDLPIMNKNDTRANERNNNNIDNCCNHSSATLGLIPATVVAVEPGFAARNFSQGDCIEL